MAACMCHSRTDLAGFSEPGSCSSTCARLSLSTTSSKNSACYCTHNYSCCLCCPRTSPSPSASPASHAPSTARQVQKSTRYPACRLDAVGCHASPSVQPAPPVPPAVACSAPQPLPAAGAGPAMQKLRPLLRAPLLQPCRNTTEHQMV